MLRSIAFASVFVTLFALAAPAESGIVEDLDAIPGMQVTEQTSSIPGMRKLELVYAQPVDHEQPLGPWFNQRLLLLHKNRHAPMIFRPEGYGLGGSGRSELTILLGGSQLSVEHRYFGKSRPAGTDYDYLDIEQAAADHHRVVQAIQPLYYGAWVSTGVSKGGMTSMYHRRFYPDDVDATVAYVAPLSFGQKDKRYISFLDLVGDAACRQRIADFQRAVLLRREELKPLLEEQFGQFGGFTRIKGGVDAAIDVGVVEYEFQFWQYGGDLETCGKVPGTDASLDVLADELADVVFYSTDIGIKGFYPYYVQSARQLGYPASETAHLADLLLYDPNDLGLYVAEEDQVAFDHQAMADIATWAAFAAERVIYIYGQLDPWTAGAFPFLPLGNDVHMFVVPGGNHGSSITDLPSAQQETALAALEGWTGSALFKSILQEKLQPVHTVERRANRAPR